VSVDARDSVALRVTLEDGAGIVCLRLAGEMDVATAGQLTEIVRSLPADQLRVQLDLSDLDFLDAAGLTALLEARAIVRARDGRLSLRRPSASVLRLLVLTDLAETFDLDE
jgi:anti-sigma B factor antagonist